MKKRIYGFFIHILFSLFFLCRIKTLDAPGRLNPKYKIKGYYGSRYLSTYLSSTFLEDDPAIVHWSTGYFIHSSNKKLMFISDKEESTIKIIQDDVIHIVVGKQNYAGYRDGDASNAVLNHPYALVSYNETAFPNEEQYRKEYKVFLFSSNSIQCKYATMNNYSVCLNTTFPTLPDNHTEIDRDKVKFINTNQKEAEPNEKDISYLFISDSDNHCIRKVDLITATVSTYAGQCTVGGFKDGPKGVNQFKNPGGIGIDDIGNLYVYDAGNNYMRMIDTTGYVHTLIQGSCFEYLMGEKPETPFNVNSVDLLCFRKWIKTEGKPSEHIYDKEKGEVCYDHIVKCPNYVSNLTSHLDEVDL